MASSISGLDLRWLIGTTWEVRDVEDAGTVHLRAANGDTMVLRFRSFCRVESVAKACPRVKAKSKNKAKRRYSSSDVDIVSVSRKHEDYDGHSDGDNGESQSLDMTM